MLKYRGYVTPSATSAIFGVSSMPNHTMNSGMRPTQGMARNMPIEESTTSSPSRKSPATSDSASAADPPIRNPVAALRPDAAMASGSSPLRVSSTACRTTSTGEASTDSGSTPVAEARNQRTTSPTGPAARRTERGTARRRPVFAVPRMVTRADGAGGCSAGGDRTAVSRWSVVMAALPSWQGGRGRWTRRTRSRGRGRRGTRRSPGRRSRGPR